MKNFLFWGLLLLALSACNSKSTVKIKGEILNAGKQKVYLEQVNVDRTIPVDSSKTDGNGRFTFKREIHEPTFYTVRIGSKEAVTLLAEPEKEIHITGNLEKLSQNYEVSGSESSLWIKILSAQLNETQTQLDSIRKIYEALPKEARYDAERTVLEADWDSAIVRQNRFSRTFIIQHAISPASYYALYQKYKDNHFVLDPLRDLQSFRIVATSMNAMHPESQYTKALLAHHEQIMEQVKSLKIRDLIQNSDNNLPEIDLPDVQGDSIRLSSLRGKYILLDFGVLTAKGSEAYIQELKNIYNKFHSKGLEIYQVCLDPDREAWAAKVRQYGIRWTCVWDAQANKSQAAAVWNIQQIPANYIINKQYEIAGKNLEGRRLTERLQDVIK